nr:MAG TPA: hypothetical protein [Bacteriophage sp.]
MFSNPKASIIEIISLVVITTLYLSSFSSKICNNFLALYFVSSSFRELVLMFSSSSRVVELM